MLRRLYDILFEYKEYAILCGLIVVSLAFLTQNDAVQIKRIRSVTVVLYGIVQEGVSFIPRYFGLVSENEMLRTINIELADEAQLLREAKLENLRLRQLLAIREQVPLPLTSAKVVAKNLSLLRNTITLNVGSSDGIKEQMPVIGDGGLVGIITMVSAHFSVVNIILNTDFRVSCKVQRSRADGIVAWDGNSLVLKNIVKTRDVKVGDVVLTSGYSNLYPKNLRIGVVHEVYDQQSVLFKSIILTPGVDFVKLEEVFVMHFSVDAERQVLEDAALQKFGK